jgi:UMF1 family MFS transporter
MGWFDQSVLNPNVRRREVFAWAMYDFANSGYTTVVLTAVFNAFFVGVIAARADWATLAWTGALAISNGLVMLTMPALGAWADKRAAKLRVLRMATVGCVLSTASLAAWGPGDVAWAMLAVIVSNYAFSVGEAVAGAFLPELARPDALGKVSGWGWSFGYVGGMLALGLALAWVTLSMAQQRGVPAAQFVPQTMIIVAVLFALAALPTFGWMRERAQPESGAPRAPGRDAWQQLAHTLARARSMPDLWRLLWCGAAYQAGIAVVIALAAVYAEAVMGMLPQQVMVLVFVVNIAAALGAFVWGYAQDWLGHKAALGVTLVGWLTMIGVAALAQGIPLFWGAAVLAGLCMGSSQSCGRAMVAYLSPATQRAEFFGLWALATRFAAIIGPLVYGMVTWVTGGHHRLAMVVTGVFFVLGLMILRGINMERGRAVCAQS